MWNLLKELSHAKQNQQQPLNVISMLPKLLLTQPG